MGQISADQSSSFFSVRWEGRVLFLFERAEAVTLIHEWFSPVRVRKRLYQSSTNCWCVQQMITVSDPPGVCLKPIKVWRACVLLQTLCELSVIEERDINVSVFSFMSVHVQSWFWAGLSLWWTVTVCLMCVLCKSAAAWALLIGFRASSVYLESFSSGPAVLNEWFRARSIRFSPSFFTV